MTHELNMYDSQLSIKLVLLLLDKYCMVRDLSLIMGRGATKLEGGGQVKFYPYKKGDKNSFSHAEGEAQ